MEAVIPCRKSMSMRYNASAWRKQRGKHGGQCERVEVDAVELPLSLPDDELLAHNDRPGNTQVRQFSSFPGAAWRQEFSNQAAKF